MEAVFQRLNGVHTVVSGYSGGSAANPTYEQVSSGNTGHAEAIQITYDPKVISYGKLLQVFWQTHDPTTPNRQGRDVGPQYRSSIFYHNEEQRALAEHYKQKLDASGAFNAPIVTEIVHFTNFYPAESYHQNYFVNHPRQPYCSLVIGPKVAEFEKVFKDELKSSARASERQITGDKHENRALGRLLGAAVVMLAAILARLTVGSSFGRDRATDAPKGDAGAAFAVVELFTSEGCSSCPPADALLAEMVQDARTHGRPVYCLAFQVDYWNRLGWTDPYSDAAFSRRQYDYAHALSLGGVYTPQMIVNGTDEFVGSDRERSRKSIDAALKRPAKTTLKLNEKKTGAGSVVITYETSSAPKGAVVNVAVAERPGQQGRPGRERQPNAATRERGPRLQDGSPRRIR